MSPTRERDDSVVATLPAELKSASAARHLAIAALEEWGRPELSDAVASVVTELVSNSILHAGSAIDVRVALVGDGARVEVSDASSVWPVMARVGDVLGGAGGMTGRGMTLVAAFAADWGIEETASGKTIWVEVGTGGRPSAARPQRTPRPSAVQPGWPEVQLIGVPVKLAVASDDHLAELIREFQLVALGDAEASEVPSAIRRTVDEIFSPYIAQWREGREAVQLLDAAGVSRIDGPIQVPPPAGNDLQRLCEVLDQVDALARRGVILSPPSPPDVAAFRHWYANELARQLAGQSPSPCPFEDPSRPDQLQPDVDADRLDRERNLALALQRNLLPRSIEPARGVRVASRYVPGAAIDEVGGDWFDVHAVDDDITVLSVGDVQGKGVHAAGYMGQLRAAARAYAMAGLDPAPALGMLDRFWAGQADVLPTCLLARYDARRSCLSVSSAGHLSPVIVSSGRAVALGLDPGPPLGVGDARYSAQDVLLAPGDVAVLFTDGVVENRRRALDEGMGQLLAVVRAAAARFLDPDALVDAIVADMGETDDDIAIVTVVVEGSRPR